MAALHILIHDSRASSTLFGESLEVALFSESPNAPSSISPSQSHYFTMQTSMSIRHLLPLREYSMTPPLPKEIIQATELLLPPREYSMTPSLPTPSPFRAHQQDTLDSLTRLLSNFTTPTYLPSPFSMPNSPTSIKALVDVPPMIPAVKERQVLESDEPASPSHTGASKNPKKIILCPEFGCKSTFSSIKHQRRHAWKHAPHKHKCVVPGCGQTSYRSDIMRAHEKSHKRTIRIIEENRKADYSRSPYSITSLTSPR
jgi:hypothetical protein